MEKKIIAIALVLVTMVTIFVGCGKRYKTIELNGKEYVLYTDADGNTMVNDDNNLVVVVTDENGETLTFENGEQQTYFVEVYGDVLDDGKIHGKYGTFKLMKGWEGTSKGDLVKTGTDNACTIKVFEAGKVSENETLEMYLDNIQTQNEAIIEELENQGYKVEISDSSVTLTLKAIDARKLVYKMTDKDGKVVHYAENYYFVNGETIYSVDYVCNNGVGYDENFDCQTYLDTNYVFLK